MTAFARGYRRWRQRLRQAFSSDEERESQRRLNEALTAGATPLARVRARDLVHVRGELVSVTLMPVHGAHRLHADLADGSGKLQLVWMGRRVVPGIVPGARLSVDGRVTVGQDGRLVMYNPSYALIAD